jgi:hypothetical protein
VERSQPIPAWVHLATKYLHVGKTELEPRARSWTQLLRATRKDGKELIFEVVAVRNHEQLITSQLASRLTDGSRGKPSSFKNSLCFAAALAISLSILTSSACVAAKSTADSFSAVLT